MECKHMNFIAMTSVGRLTADDDPEKIVGFAAEITIKCSDCGIPFRFLGVRPGISSEHPNVSIDLTELRVPIKPSDDPVENVRWIASGRAPHLRDPLEYPDGHPILLGDQFKTPFGTITVKCNSSDQIDYIVDATRHRYSESRKEFADNMRTKKYLRL